MINYFIYLIFFNINFIFKFFTINLFYIYFIYFMGIGDWGLGIGDWGLGPIPNPQSPIPNPQSPFQNYEYLFFILKIKYNHIYFK